MATEKSQVVYNEKTEADQHISTKVDDAVQLNDDVVQQRYSPWTPSMWKLYGVLWLAYLCGCLNGTCIRRYKYGHDERGLRGTRTGYDGSLMGGVSAMKTYQSFFKLCVLSKSSN